MKTLIVYESWFGGAKCASDAIAGGLRAFQFVPKVVDIREGQPALDRGYRLIVIGAPTHERDLPTPETQSVASIMSGRPFCGGIREWLETASFPSDVYVALFDTITGNKWFAGSAAKVMVKFLIQHKQVRPISAISFRISNIRGVLRPGEEDRAYEWGRSLGQHYRDNRGV